MAHKAKTDFTHASGTYEKGQTIKVKNEAVLNDWKKAGLIEEVEEETKEEENQ